MSRSQRGGTFLLFSARRQKQTAATVWDVSVFIGDLWNFLGRNPDYDREHSEREKAGIAL